MKKSIFKVVTGAVLISSLLFTGCANNGGNNVAKSSKKKYVVGICQLVQHEALDSATNGFKEALKKHYGDDIEILEQNASGDSSNCITIVNNFVSQKVDLIMANATPALQAAVSITKDIPILGTSVTDYATALEISDFNGTVGTNVSGTSDLAPLKEQADIFDEIAPEAKTIGILYCNSEANSVYQANEVEKCLLDKNLTVKKFTFTDSNDIMQVTQNACEQVDAIYVPTDNMAANNAEIIGTVVENKKIPVVAGEQNICKGCGVATLSIDYKDLGIKTGQMAIEILDGTKKVSEMPIEYSPNPKKMVNKKMADAINITVPSNYETIE